MAFLHLFLQSMLLFTFILFINGICSSKTPLSFSCGNGVEFGYPFWQQSQKTGHSGYPGFSISCIDKIPTIQLDNHLYQVKRVNDTEETIVVSFYELGDAICPVGSHGVSMNSSAGFLDYSNDVEMVYFFYNCTVYPSGVEPIKCLQIGSRHAYVFLEGSVPEFDWNGHCGSLMTIPLMKKNVDSSLTTSFGKAMRDGFELKWSSDLECKYCEASGGFCQYDHDTNHMVSCHCGNKRRYTNCHDEGLMSSNLKLGLLSIGLLICCLMLLGAAVYVIKKRKDNIHKRGFDPISSREK